MTNLLLERLLRGACFTFLAVMLVLVLAACGPGGGGTGTGPTASYTNTLNSTGSSAGASSSSSTLVSIPALSTPAPGDASAGSCGRVILLLTDGRVELATGCGSFVFEGEWAADVNQQVVLPGTLRNTAAGTAIPATLLLQFNGMPETSQSVTVTVAGEAGQRLVGPEVLGRTENERPAP